MGERKRVDWAGGGAVGGEAGGGGGDEIWVGVINKHIIKEEDINKAYTHLP